VFELLFLKKTVALLVVIEGAECGIKQYEDADIDAEKAVKTALFIRF